MADGLMPQAIADALDTGQIAGAQIHFNINSGLYEYQLNYQGFIVYGEGTSPDEAAADALSKTSKAKPRAEWKGRGKSKGDDDQPPSTDQG